MEYKHKVAVPEDHGKQHFLAASCALNGIHLHHRDPCISFFNQRYHKLIYCTKYGTLKQYYSPEEQLWKVVNQKN